MGKFYKIVFLFCALALFIACSSSKIPQEPTFEAGDPVNEIPVLLKMNTDLILVFTKTTGFRHDAIEKGVETLKSMGLAHNFVVSHTEDASAFTSKNLRKYKTVVFLNTTMDVLNSEQQKAFEAYIQTGGSFLGVHAAADTEYEWPWYGKLVGAYFESHPKQQEALIEVIDRDHPSTAHLGAYWTHFDEWYNYKNINPDIKVLLRLDEKSYQGGTNGDNHPIAWYHEYDGGKAFYTGLGHTKASYDNPTFKRHLLGGLLYCLGS